MVLPPHNEQLIINFLTKKLNPYLLILFGSAATDQMHEDSDLDIAYLTDQNYDDYARFLIAQELASKVGYEVDLVNLQKASTVLQTEIVSKGKVIYCTDHLRRMNFHMKVLSQYVRLNEERQIVIDKIKE